MALSQTAPFSFNSLVVNVFDTGHVSSKTGIYEDRGGTIYPEEFPLSRFWTSRLFSPCWIMESAEQHELASALSGYLDMIYLSELQLLRGLLVEG